LPLGVAAIKLTNDFGIQGKNSSLIKRNYLFQ